VDKFGDNLVFNVEELWKKVVDNLQQQLVAESFSLWIQPLKTHIAVKREIHSSGAQQIFFRLDHFPSKRQH